MPFAPSAQSQTAPELIVTVTEDRNLPRSGKNRRTSRVKKAVEPMSSCRLVFHAPVAKKEEQVYAMECKLVISLRSDTRITIGSRLLPGNSNG